jgi:hypothetical protein
MSPTCKLSKYNGCCMTDIVGKLWGFCHTLRHDGIDYGDYIEQLTYLLFLKMIEEKGAEIPPEYSWAILREKSGTELTDHYMTTLRKLVEKKGMLGDIYAGAISRFSNPVNLKRLVNLIDEVEWTGLNVDVKAAASGVKWNETYTDPASDRRKYLEFQIASNKPEAIFDLMKS